MNVKIEGNKIWLYDEDTDTSRTIIEKPQIDDYANVTARPLVVNYHLNEETIWERACHFVEKLQSVCMDSCYFADYILLFRELYFMLMSSSQMKNIICYGMEEKSNVSSAFQSFMDFMKKGSSFIALPMEPFVFSALLNSSCQAAVVCLDACESLRIVFDAASKVRNGGKLFLYTRKEIPAELSDFLSHAEKSSFGLCALYAVTVDEEIHLAAQENNSEAAMMPSAGALLHQFEELKALMAMPEKQGKGSPEIYLYIVELLWQMEKNLLALYDVLENPELPVCANSMKEAAMDCYIGISGQVSTRNYDNRMARESRIFMTAMEAEFG
ncbi:MAG: hypothetical protein NC341_02040 [Blautia sp.]|nr:hypothetical protein [Blautia sp.]MCM1200398.1 hypothetical protein [Bacteroides fragilis]